MRRLTTAGALLAALTCAMSARATTVPAVPIAVQHAIKTTAVVPIVPTRVPAGYRYIKWSRGRRGFDIYFGTTKTPTLDFDVLLTSCASYGHPMKTFHMNGLAVYWSATHEDQQAWRCITRGKERIGIKAGASIAGDDATKSPAQLRHALNLVELVAYAHLLP